MVKVRRPEVEGESGAVTPSEFEGMLGKRLGMEMVAPGEIVTGTVVSVGKEWVFVDIGSKSEGMVATAEFMNAAGELEVKPGDNVEATVLTLRGGIRLSRSLKKSHQTTDVLQDAYNNQIPVEGRVKEVRKGGFGVEIGGGQMAFCPISQIDSKYVEKAEEYLDQTFSFRVIEFSPEGRNVVLSRRALLEEEKQALARETRERLKPGALFDGVVRKLMPYGAFVGIGGVDGLVHVSEIAWDRVENPADYLQEGQTVKVKVLSYAPESDKLALSIREAGEDPWDTVTERFPVGVVVSGTVTRVEGFGAFVRIATGVEGLVHISDITWTARLRHASEVVNVGDVVHVQVLNVDRDKKRLSLGMKQVQGDPFAGITERYPLGKVVKGTVKRVGSGGVFVELEEGVVGFLPGSLAGVARGEPLGTAYKPGAAVELQVKEVDPEKRHVTLMVSNVAAEEEKSEFNAFMKRQGVVPQKLGSFGELLQKALDKKK